MAFLRFSRVESMSGARVEGRARREVEDTRLGLIMGDGLTLAMGGGCEHSRK
jgi:hypothetical protein